MKDYSFYVEAAYGLCFAVLIGMTLTTLIAWKKVQGKDK